MFYTQTPPPIAIALSQSMAITTQLPSHSPWPSQPSYPVTAHGHHNPVTQSQPMAITTQLPCHSPWPSQPSYPVTAHGHHNAVTQSQPMAITTQLPCHSPWPSQPKYPVTALGHHNPVTQSQPMVIITQLPPHTSLCTKAADVFNVPLKAACWPHNLQNRNVPTFHLPDAISSLAADVTSLESCSGGQIPNFALNYSPWTSPATCLFRFHTVMLVWIFQCFPAHDALHTADRFRAFVLFNFKVCSYTEPSPVSTYHYFCCFVLWAHIITSCNAVDKGMEQKCDNNWLCFNTVTKFCSTLAFRVQFKRLLLLPCGCGIVASRSFSVSLKVLSQGNLRRRSLQGQWSATTGWHTNTTFSSGFFFFICGSSLSDYKLVYCNTLSGVSAALCVTYSNLFVQYNFQFISVETL